MGFTEEERQAMLERARETKADAKGERDDAKAEKDVLEKIAELSEPDRTMAERLHATIKAQFPVLKAKAWYGMPAYYKNGKVVCFFQSAQKFKVRYSTLGFSEAAGLDDGEFWPVAYALKDLNAPVEAQIIALVAKAVG